MVLKSVPRKEKKEEGKNILSLKLVSYLKPFANILLTEANKSWFAKKNEASLELV
jgi:hypothetical protein